MNRFILLASLTLAGCATGPSEIKRLSPSLGTAKIPSQCRVVSVMKDSVAEKAGITAGDILKTVNGQAPADASALSDLVRAASQDAEFEVIKQDGTTQKLKIHLNAGHPRLGSVCDLSGWEKPGVTAAGNESVTVFDGPLALTTSGIIDKGIVFLRVRISNNSNRPLEISPGVFSATDGGGASLTVLSPKEVMCFLYGEKGAHLLALKKKQKETLDSHQSVPGIETAADEHCEGGSKGRMAGSDTQYAEANAQYLAAESLWPTSYAPGAVADGLIYLKEPGRLPVTLTGSLDGRTLVTHLGVPQASERVMKRSELVKFFETQKRGNALRLTLRKGKVFVGKFATYDTIEERVWFDKPSGGMLNTTSYPVESIRYAEPLEQIPSKTAPLPSELN